MPDAGVYLIQFIENHFPRGSEFKKLPKVLADELRHDLVHGFGSSGREPGIRLPLGLKPDTTVQIKVGKRRGKETIVMNAIAFADPFLAAFRRVKDLVEAGSASALISRMARAARLQLPVRPGVRNQFDKVYGAAKKRGLVTTFGRRLRGPAPAAASTAPTPA